jgi:DNA-binding beta-propeller fold protein YncE
MDAQGNLYVSDAGENNRIRKIAPGGAVTTLAGGREGFADGAGALGSFNTPSGLAVDFAGNIYVADTGNNRIRKVTPAGLVSTLAGDGTAGLRDGPAASAQLNAPLGVAADARGNVYVADTYNDCIRLITPDGQVRTVAGGAKPGYMDGAASEALFDTPCSVVVTPAGELFVADTGNQRIRKITKDGQVTTLPVSLPEGLGQLASPVGLALTHDGFLYVTEKDRGRVLQVAPDGRAYLVAGLGSGFADGDGQGRARFNRPAGVAIGADGALYVADGANYLVRKIAPAQGAQVTGTDETGEVLPRLSAQTIAAGGGELPWPVDPQRHAHEVVATVGEVRGSYEGEARDHLHSGLDIQAPMGATVRVIYEEKVTDPLCNWGFGELSEGLRAGLFSYIHMRVGLDKDDRPLKDSPFTFLRDEQGKVSRVRVKRGTRLRVGDAARKHDNRAVSNTIMPGILF